MISFTVLVTTATGQRYNVGSLTSQASARRLADEYSTRKSVHQASVFAVDKFIGYSELDYLSKDGVEVSPFQVV